MIESERQEKIFKTSKNEPNSLNSSTKAFITTKIKADKFSITKENKNINEFMGKKKYYFEVKDFYKKKNIENSDSKTGRWTLEEHNKFLDGLILFGSDWKKVNSLIKARTAVQVRSHAQKFFKKMKICKEEKLGIDFTLKSICNLNDMIIQIKSVNNDFYNIKNVFIYLSQKYGIKRSKNSNSLHKRIDLSNIISNIDNNFNLDENKSIINNSIIPEDQKVNKEIKIIKENNNISSPNNDFLINNMFQSSNLINNHYFQAHLNEYNTNNFLLTNYYFNNALINYISYINFLSPTNNLLLNQLNIYNQLSTNTQLNFSDINMTQFNSNNNKNENNRM